MTIGPAAQIQHHLATQRSRNAQYEQHLPRPARVRLSVETKGIGFIAMTGRKAINFGSLVLEEPSFTWGVTSLTVIKDSEMPMCTATVLKWVKNGHGLYTGAEMGFRVDSDNSNIHLKFSLVFEGSTLRSSITGDGNDSIVVATEQGATTTFVK